MKSKEHYLSGCKYYKDNIMGEKLLLNFGAKFKC